MLSRRGVLVWGNCQAEPLADLLRAPMGRRGLEVWRTPPVYLVTAAELAQIHADLARCAVLVTQPIGDDYHLPGCASASLMSELPPHASVITVPVAYHVGPFPYQVRAHGADGARVDAPITDYHDLRAVVAAHRGLDVDAALSWWPAPSAAAVDAVRSGSLRELAAREAALDVQLASTLDQPGALWTMTHPTNRVLAELAGQVLERLGLAVELVVPQREFLAERRTPIEAAVADAYGWPVDAVRPHWSVRERAWCLRDVLTVQLDFYRRRPDVVADTLARHRLRMGRLGLASDIATPVGVPAPPPGQG